MNKRYNVGDKLICKASNHPMVELNEVVVVNTILSYDNSIWLSGYCHWFSESEIDENFKIINSQEIQSKEEVDVNGKHSNY